MKNKLIYPLFILVTIFCFGSLQAQKPNKILGIAKEVQPSSYYKTQSDLWQKEIASNPGNAEAWINYYRAERAYLQLEDPDLWSDGKEDFYAKLNPILKKAQKAIGNTFDYHYLKGMNTHDLEINKGKSD